MRVRERGGVAGSSGGAGEDLQAVVAVRDGVHEAAAAAPGLERQDPGVVEADRPHGEALGLVALARAVGVEAVAEPGEVGRELLELGIPILGICYGMQLLALNLADDVLAALPASVREFLLRTSILRHVHAPLCDALMQRTDSAERLEQLHAANLFLAPIEGEAGGYRYHSLFAGYLRAQLAREHPDELAGDADGEARRTRLARTRRERGRHGRDHEW